MARRHSAGGPFAGVGISCLPEDVLLRVAALVEQNPLGDGSARDLRSFTEVCKEWRRIGRTAASRLVLLCHQQRVSVGGEKKLEQRVKALYKMFPNTNSFSFCGHVHGVNRVSEVLGSRESCDLRHALRKLEFRGCSHNPFVTTEVDIVKLSSPNPTWGGLESLALRGRHMVLEPAVF